MSFSVRSSFALPYMTGCTDDAQGPLFLRAVGVPFWALVRDFGKDAMYWYRLEAGLGRNSLVGTTVRRAATHQAWRVLFPLVVLLRCCLHGWLNIRSRGKLSEAFIPLSEMVWDAYHAPDRRSFGQRLRRLWEWSRRNVKAAWVLEQVQKLCGRSKEYGQAYSHPGGHRTSNMLDRVMRSLSRYFVDGQHLHGSKGACERHCRGGRCCTTSGRGT